MAELKTKKTTASVKEFLDGIADEQQRADAKVVAKMMREIVGAKPRMWGTSIVGFGDYHYKYASGREGDWFLAGFSPRKNALTLYLMGGLLRGGDTLKKLGKCKTSMGCIYVKKLADIDLDVLRELIRINNKALLEIHDFRKMAFAEQKKRGKKKAERRQS
ncbi:MAG TPA: DUF1801 domain-containing protein [Gemmataceae bacterium]|nr:DUF1801 domain-containing protein [Gemmataceae bacterium]